MALPSLGWDCVVGIGHETTAGTPVAATKFIEHVKVTGGLVRGISEGDTIRKRSTQRLIAEPQEVMGSIEFEAGYEGYEDLFYHLFGKAAVVTTNTTAKQHTLTFDDATTFPVGMTLQVKYGTVGCKAWTGANVMNLALNAEVGKILKASFGLTAMDEVTDTADTPSFPSPVNPLIWTQLALTKDAVTKEVRSVQLSFDNGMETGRGVLGSASVKQATMGRRKVSGIITSYLEDFADWWDTFDADTEFGVVLKATGGAIAGSSPTDYYDFVLTVPNVRIEKLDKDIGAPGPVEQVVGFIARDGGSEVASLVITNLRATIP